MFGFGNLFPEPARPFNTQYKCYSVSMLPGNERQDVERGGKIIMPPSALDQLTRLNIVYPMLFKLTNTKADRVTHCGVLEFVADEGKVYLPYWLMRNLLLEEGGLLQVESASLPVATFSKFQPQSEDFLDITNPKAVLENALRNFACLTAGDVVAIKYNDKVYELCVLETKPGKGVSIIECDMNVDFAPPVGYKEPERPGSKASQEDEPMQEDNQYYEDTSKFVAFSGHSNRLDGKKKSANQSEQLAVRTPARRGVPDYDYKKGHLRFIRTLRTATNGTEVAKSSSEDFEAFSGEGNVLRSKSRK